MAVGQPFSGVANSGNPFIDFWLNARGNPFQQFAGGAGNKPITPVETLGGGIESTEPSRFTGATFGRAGELGHTFTGFADTLIEGGDEALTGALEDILTGIFGEIDTLEGTKTSPEQLNARLGELGNQIAAGRTALTQQSSREAQRRGVFSQGLADAGASQASAQAQSARITGETQIRDTVADHNAQIDALIASLRGDVGEAIGGAKAQSLALNVAGREAQTLNDNLQLFGRAQADAQLFQSFLQPIIPPLLQFLFRGGR